MRLLSTLFFTLLFCSFFSSCDKTSKNAIQTPALASECMQEPDPGPCKGAFNYYYYDKSEKKCKTFIYGGCKGNVPFKTLKECQNGCNCE